MLNSKVRKYHKGIGLMSLATDKTRISLYLDEKLKDWVTDEAKKKNRSMSNYIETVLDLIRQGKVKVEDKDI